MNFDRSFKNLNLRQKTLLLLVLFLTGLTGISYLLSSTILLGSLKTAEEQSAQQSVQGILNVFAKEQQSFTLRYSDWSAWDDTYKFIQDRNQDYIKSNLIPAQLSNLKVNVAIFINSNNKIIYGTGFDLKSKELKPVPQTLLDYLQSQNPSVLEKVKENQTLTGLINLPEGPMLVTLQPILTSEGKRPVKGILIFGRYIDAEAIDNLSRITQFPIELYSLTQKDLPADLKSIQSSLSLKSPIALQTVNQESLSSYVLLKDLNQQPALILKVRIPREIYQQTQKSQNYLIVGLIISGIISGAFLLIFMERLVLSRLIHLSVGVNQIYQTNDLSLRLRDSGKDEISSLTKNINEMLEKLEQSHLEVSHALHELKKTQMQLVQSEKMSSLGQLVAGIAHEINNPINFISGNIPHAIAYAQDLTDLFKLYQTEEISNQEKQKKLEEIDFEFLIQDLPHLLKSMQTGASRIRDIVNALRVFSRLDEAEVKYVQIHEGIDSALLILQNRLISRGHYPAVEVIKEYGKLPKIECYAGQLNQVFMNLFSNGLDALEQKYDQLKNSPSISYQPTLRVRTELIDDQHIRITIADNGTGVPETIKPRLFDPFFTTKPVGQGTGLGLSISYQIIEQHGGSLDCFSEPDQGAEFRIELPIRISGLPSLH